MRTRYLFVCITTLALRVSSGAKSYFFWGLFCKTELRL